MSIVLRATFLPLVATAAMALTPTPGSAQVPVRTIPGEPTCASCRIVLDTIAIVGSLQDSVLIGDNIGGLVVLPGDTILVGGTMFGGGPNMVFAPDGRLVRTIGRSGEGPGELDGQVGIARYSDDEVLVTQGGRLSLMNTAGEVSTQVTDSRNAHFRFEPAPDGRILYSSPSRRAEMRFEIFSPELEVVHAFDPLRTEEREQCSGCSSRSTVWAADRPDHFWASRRAIYQIELWSDQGDLADVLRVRGSEWLETEEEPLLPESIRNARGIVIGGPPAPTPRPHSEIWDLDQDSEGLLWITGRATPDDWEPFPGGLPPMTPTNATPEIVAWRERTQSHAVLDVIDPVTGTLVARRVLEHLPLAFANGPHYYLKQQDEYGVVSYVVMRARLVGR